MFSLPIFSVLCTSPNWWQKSRCPQSFVLSVLKLALTTISPHPRPAPPPQPFFFFTGEWKSNDFSGNQCMSPLPLKMTNQKATRAPVFHAKRLLQAYITGIPQRYHGVSSKLCIVIFSAGGGSCNLKNTQCLWCAIKVCLYGWNLVLELNNFTPKSSGLRALGACSSDRNTWPSVPSAVLPVSHRNRARQLCLESWLLFFLLK